MLEPPPLHSVDASGGPDTGSPSPPEPARGWISAADSTFTVAFEKGRRQCFAHTGCPFTPVQVPVCPEDTVPIPMSEATAAVGDSGKTVVMTAVIQLILDKKSGHMGCTEPCCEMLIGRTVLAPSLTPTADQAVPRDPNHPDAFLWVGDSTATCVGIAVSHGQEVVARGDLKPVAFSTTHYWLMNPQLCVPEQEMP